MKKREGSPLSYPGLRSALVSIVAPSGIYAAWIDMQHVVIIKF